MSPPPSVSRLGTLGVAGTAAAAPAAQPAVSAAAVAPRAVNNLGLTSAEAKKVQRDIKANWGYKGGIDGLLGTESWKGIQRPLKKYNGYKGKIDGIVGKETVKALQRLLKARYGYTGAIDGIAAPAPRPPSSASPTRSDLSHRDTFTRPTHAPTRVRTGGPASPGRLRCVRVRGGGSRPQEVLGPGVRVR
ncbi:hypothetical protein ACFQVA_24770 [Actinomadura keratinilytica]